MSVVMLCNHLELEVSIQITYLDTANAPLPIVESVLLFMAICFAELALSYCLSLDIGIHVLISLCVNGIVYRLMTCGATLEEKRVDKIYRMQIYKGGLFKTAIEHKEKTCYFSQQSIMRLVIKMCGCNHLELEIDCYEKIMECVTIFSDV
uniref:Uncharacterized protein n=1 Tax=Chenopodium quinoa TaxID=63459 RepID=A0A803KNA3_CHEQI